MKCAVIANGEWDGEWGKNELASYDVLIAADGGGNRVIEAGFFPDILVGDLDSITTENLERCRQYGTEIIQYPREKDETDLELALELAVARIQDNGISPGSHSDSLDSLDRRSLRQERFHTIDLLGATGGRVDHLLGNLALLLSFLKKGYRIRGKDPTHEFWLIQGREYIKGQTNQEISLIPVTEYATVRTEGLYYPLHQEILRQDSPRGISNVFLGEDAFIEVSEGIVLVVLLSPKTKR